MARHSTEWGKDSSRTEVVCGICEKVMRKDNLSIDLLDIKNEAKVTVIEEEAAKKDKNDSKTNTTCEITDDLKQVKKITLQ